MARWFALPAQDAHASWLPSRHHARSVRAIRLASASLMSSVGGLPTYETACSHFGAGGLPVPQEWQAAFLAAGVRYFSSGMRLRTGDALTAAIAAQMGAVAWRAALQWIGPTSDVAALLHGKQAMERVECFGSEIILRYVVGTDGAFKRRVQLRYPRSELELCRATLPVDSDSECERIAAAVLVQGGD